MKIKRIIKIGDWNIVVTSWFCWRCLTANEDWRATCRGCGVGK